MNYFSPHDVLVYVPPEIFVELVIGVFREREHLVEKDLVLANVDAKVLQALILENDVLKIETLKDWDWVFFVLTWIDYNMWGIFLNF